MQSHEERKKAVKNATRRSNLFRTLAVQWIRAKRPDIAEIIQAEVDAKIPNVIKIREAVYLPKSLRDLK